MEKANLPAYENLWLAANTYIAYKRFNVELNAAATRGDYQVFFKHPLYYKLAMDGWNDKNKVAYNYWLKFKQGLENQGYTVSDPDPDVPDMIVVSWLNPLWDNKSF